MLVYLRDPSAHTIVHAATLRYKLQLKVSFSPCHSVLTADQPIPALTLHYQAPGRVAPGVPIFKSLVWLNPEKLPQQKRNPTLARRSRGRCLNHSANQAFTAQENRNQPQCLPFSRWTPLPHHPPPNSPPPPSTRPTNKDPFTKPSYIFIYE